jgi:hypothetical protein
MPAKMSMADAKANFLTGKQLENAPAKLKRILGVLLAQNPF